MFFIAGSIAWGSVTLEFFPDSRKIIPGVVQTASVITGVRVIAAPVVKPVFGFAVNILAAVRAVCIVIIDGIINQPGGKLLGVNKVLAVLIRKEREGHLILTENFLAAFALHMQWILRVWVADQVVVIGAGIHGTRKVGLQEVEIGFPIVRPGPVEAE